MGLDEGEVVIDADVEVSLGHHLDAERAIVVDDALLHICGVRRHQREPLDAADREQLVQR
jgi:hypothetical protein